MNAVFIYERVIKKDLHWNKMLKRVHKQLSVTWKVEIYEILFSYFAPSHKSASPDLCVQINFWASLFQPEDGKLCL